MTRSPSDLAPRPLHAIHLADAHRHLDQAIASIRAAAALDPRTARAVSPTHISLVDALEALGELQSLPGRPKPMGLHGVPTSGGRPGDPLRSMETPQ